MPHPLRLDLPDADVVLHPTVPLPGPPQALGQRLLAELPWQQRDVVLFGRRLLQPRLIAWHGDPQARYRYSRQILEPAPWTPLLTDLRQAVEAVAGRTFNSVLVNGYRDGHDRMGAHSDDEPELGPAPVIASLSLGAPRPFVFHSRHQPRRPSLRVVLPDGSLLLMAGDTQRWWKHSLPPLREACGWRVNLTFRTILPLPERGRRREPPVNAPAS